MKKTTDKEISIIITAHNEGIIVHKTILCILRAVKELEKNNISYEIIIGLDNPDQDTLDYFKRWRKDKRFTILEVSFGNPAENRNNAIQHANGKYTSIIDGDDLITRKWLIDSYNLIKKHKEPVILHPEVHFQFGLNEHVNTLWIMHESSSKEKDAIAMAYWNRWTNAHFTHRSISLKFPYDPPVDGFGYEDYHFNCQTRAGNIPHLITPGSVLFYRRMESSVASSHWRDRTVLAYSDLFDTQYLKSIKLTKEAKKELPLHQKVKIKSKNLFKRTYRLAYDTAKHTPIINKAVAPIAKNILYKKHIDSLPKFLIDEWRDINSIENQLYPTKGAVAQLQFHPLSFNPHDDRAGLVYRKILDHITKNPDYLFLTPKLSIGGTEKLMFNYINALQKAHPKWQIAVLSSRPPKSSLYKIPKNVDFIDFDGLTQSLSDYEREIIWSRLFVQLRVKRLHLINNERWYRWIAEHKTLLSKNNYKVNVSLFMREYAHEKDRVQTFADPFISEIYPTVNKIFTDNQNVIDEALENNAFDPKKFIVHYQPEEVEKTIKPKKINSTKPLRILWASRVSFQKRPDILKKIAKQINSKDFEIHAYGRLQHYEEDFFSGIKGLKYKGEFNGVSSIDTTKYDAYLYTSETDGVPNILLEITATGLPIVASNAGGIREFIKDGKTGALVEIENIDGYIKALNDFKKHPVKTQKLALAAQKLLQSQHSLNQFEKNVKKDIT